MGTTEDEICTRFIDAKTVTRIFSPGPVSDQPLHRALTCFQPSRAARSGDEDANSSQKLRMNWSGVGYYESVYDAWHL